MPRRTAFLPEGPAFVGQWEPAMQIMVLGGLLLVPSAILLLWNLVLTQVGKPHTASREIEYAETVRPVLTLPKAMNGFALWNAILVVYMVMDFGYPILQFFLMETHGALPWGS
jgi:cytochrome c oxidase subunit 1